MASSMIVSSSNLINKNSSLNKDELLRISKMQKDMYDRLVDLESKKSSNEYSATNYTSISDYSVLKHLGKGAYGWVTKAIHKETQMVLAIKVYEKFKLMKDLRKRAVNREIKVLRKLDHKNII